MEEQANVTYPKKSAFQEVYHHWFQGLGTSPLAPSDEVYDRWMGRGSLEKRKEHDEENRAAFARYLNPLLPDKLTAKLPRSYDEECQHATDVAKPFLEQLGEINSADGASNALGLVLLLDQMTRGIYRDNQKVIYAHFDVICRSICRTMLANDMRPDLHGSIRQSTGHRMWFYLPWMHSEYLEDHAIFEKLFKEMRAEIEPLPDVQKEPSGYTIKFYGLFELFERKHTEILEKFQRYPHRNKHLNRQNTTQEQEFLDNGGETFRTD